MAFQVPKNCKSSVSPQQMQNHHQYPIHSKILVQISQYAKPQEDGGLVSMAGH
jgi:hypothetical protein